MTDILDLDGWNVIAKHVDGDDYLEEAERRLDAWREAEE